MKLKIIDLFTRSFLLSACLWVLFITTLSLSIHTHLSLEEAKAQLHVVETFIPLQQQPAGDTIVVLNGQMLGIGCFQIIPVEG